MNRIFNLILIVLLLAVGNKVFAIGDQPVVSNAKASISGKVIDNKTGESLVGVAVSIEGTDTKAYTNLDGSFVINNLDPGSYNLILSLISYKNSLVENLKVNPSEKEVIDVKLDAVR
jgi:hypothetical protein